MVLRSIIAFGVVGAIVGSILVAQISPGQTIMPEAPRQEPARTATQKDAGAKKKVKPEKKSNKGAVIGALVGTATVVGIGAAVAISASKGKRVPDPLSKGNNDAKPLLKGGVVPQEPAPDVHQQLNTVSADVQKIRHCNGLTLTRTKFLIETAMKPQINQQDLSGMARWAHHLFVATRQSHSEQLPHITMQTYKRVAADLGEKVYAQAQASLKKTC